MEDLDHENRWEEGSKADERVKSSPSYQCRLSFSFSTQATCGSENISPLKPQFSVAANLPLILLPPLLLPLLAPITRLPAVAPGRDS